MPATALCPISTRLGHAGRAMAQMTAISITTIAMRIARYVRGSALLMTYLVPMKPVLHSRTKIAGAARAANLLKSCFICRPCCPIICYAARTDRAGRYARFHISKPAIEALQRGMPWMFAPPSPSLHFISPKELGKDLVPHLVDMTKSGADQIVVA